MWVCVAGDRVVYGMYVPIYTAREGEGVCLVVRVGEMIHTDLYAYYQTIDLDDHLMVAQHAPPAAMLAAVEEPLHELMHRWWHARVAVCRCALPANLAAHLRRLVTFTLALRLIKLKEVDAGHVILKREPALRVRAAPDDGGEVVECPLLGLVRRREGGVRRRGRHHRAEDEEPIGERVRLDVAEERPDAGHLGGETRGL